MTSLRYWLFGLLFYISVQHVAPTPTPFLGSNKRTCSAEEVKSCMDRISANKINIMDDKSRITANNHTNTMLSVLYQHKLAHPKEYICGPQVTPPVGPPIPREAPPDVFEEPPTSPSEPTGTNTASSVSPKDTSASNGTGTTPPAPAASHDFCADLDKCEAAGRREGEGLEAQMEVLRDQRVTSDILNTLLKQCEPRPSQREKRKEKGDARQRQRWTKDINTCNTLLDEVKNYRSYQEHTLDALIRHQHGKRGNHTSLNTVSQTDDYTSSSTAAFDTSHQMGKRFDPVLERMNTEFTECQGNLVGEWQRISEFFDAVTAKYEELGEWKGPGPLIIPEPPPAPHRSDLNIKARSSHSDLDTEGLADRKIFARYPHAKYDELISSGEQYIVTLITVNTKMADLLRTASSHRNRLGRDNALCTWRNRNCKEGENTSGGAAKDKDTDKDKEKDDKIKKLEDEKVDRLVKDLQTKLGQVSEELKECKASKATCTKV